MCRFKIGDIIRYDRYNEFEVLVIGIQMANGEYSIKGVYLHGGKASYVMGGYDDHLFTLVKRKIKYINQPNSLKETYNVKALS